MPPRVLVLTPSLASAGGIQRYTNTLLRALRDDLGDDQVRSVAMEEASNRRRLSARSKLGFAFRGFLEVVRCRPDLIITTHLALGPIAWVLAMVCGRPYWIVVYGIESWCLLPYAKHRALLRANRLLAISAFTREQLVKGHGVKLEHTTILPCNLDETLVNAAPSRNGWCATLPDKYLVVLTVARMAASEAYKGHDAILRALSSVIAKFRDIVYVVAGEGDDRPRLELLARELGVAEHVLFTGNLSDSELAALYRRCDVFAMPARTVLDDRRPKGEGFGIVFLEAMAFGKPVIGPNYGAPAEVIRHGETGLLVDPEDPKSVADALLQLLQNPDLARRMGAYGAQWVRENYSYDHFRAQLRSLLDFEAAAPIAAAIQASHS